eukprot:782054-Amphidinium_carterae.1
MEQEALAPYGYEVQETSGFKDRLATTLQSSTVATIGALRLLSDQEIGGLATSFMFVLAAGAAPVRAAPNQEMEIVTFTFYRHYDGDVVWRLMVSTLLISITTLVIAVCTSMRMCQQQVKPQRRSTGTQTTQFIDREISTTRVRGPDDPVHTCSLLSLSKREC